MDMSTFLNPTDEDIDDPIDTTELIDHIAETYSEVREANEIEAEERSIEPIAMDQLLAALNTVLLAEEEQGTLDMTFQEGLRRRLYTINLARIRALNEGLQQTRIENFFGRQN